MMDESLQQTLRDLATMAEELETAGHMEKIEEFFREWRQGRIVARDLNRKLFEYLRGPMQELHSHYHFKSVGQNVANAIKRGILNRDDVPNKVIEFLTDARYF